MPDRFYGADPDRFSRDGDAPDRYTDNVDDRLAPAGRGSEYRIVPDRSSEMGPDRSSGSMTEGARQEVSRKRRQTGITYYRT